MVHRHLDSPGYALAAIDDIVGRGSLRDWIELDVAAAADASVMDGIRTIVSVRPGDESSIGHDFWRTRILLRRSGSGNP